MKEWCLDHWILTFILVYTLIECLGKFLVTLSLAIALKFESDKKDKSCTK